MKTVQSADGTTIAFDQLGKRPRNSLHCWRSTSQCFTMIVEEEARALMQEFMFIQTERTRTTPFDALAFGLTSGTDKSGDAAHVASFAQAGATWWLEHFAPHQTLEQVRQRIQQGPPRF